MFDVYTFADWELANKSMRIFEPQLILLDVFLTGIDGLDVCQKLKASPFTRHVPILLFSAFPLNCRKRYTRITERMILWQNPLRLAI